MTARRPETRLPRAALAAAGRGRLHRASRQLASPTVSGVSLCAGSRRRAGHHRAVRLRQDDAGAGDHRRLAAGTRRDHARRRAARPVLRRGSRRGDRLSAAGCRSVRRHHRRQHRPLRAWPHRRSGAAGRATRRRARHDPEIPAGLRHQDRRRRAAAFVRPAPAHRAGARALSAIPSSWCSTSPIPISTATARRRSTARWPAVRARGGIVVLIAHRRSAIERRQQAGGDRRRPADRVRPEGSACWPQIVAPQSDARQSPPPRLRCSISNPPT